MRKPIRFIAAAMAIAIALMISVPSEAEKHRQDLTADEGMGLCLIQGGDNNWGSSSDPDNPYGCSGLVCYCCLDDGCYICDNEGYDCTWDGKASRLSIRRRLGLPTIGPTTVNPGPITRPPRVRPPAPGILEGGGTLLPQGPAPAGKPTAPPPPPGRLQ